MADFLNELNEGQRAAVLYNEGPSLVIAGAGSGKTRVLTYKIAYLLENGYQPWNILALTFTNKAAREMKERIGRQVGQKRARYLWMGTFHSVFSRILRSESQYIGFTSHFTIYDASDSKSLIRSIIKEMNLDEKVYKPGSVQSRISNAKNHLVSPAAYAANKDVYKGDVAAKMPAIRDIYSRYQERCRQAGSMDFDDLLVYTYMLFKNHPEVLERYREQFRYILVDEYQDTNYAQHSIVLQLAGAHQHVCVVGDDAQSIYSFRGADIDNILYFTKIYPGTKVFKLEQNYRSTQNIVHAANSLIAKNEHQIHKEVFSENAHGEVIGLFEAYSDLEEGVIVANKMTELSRKKEYTYNDFAILYRTNAQSRVFEESFRKRGIPYKIYGGLSFYQRKEIKDIISYFRLVVNPNDEEAFKRIINYPARGIGDTTVNKIIVAATAHGVSLWQAMCEPLQYGIDINKGTHAKLQGFREMVEGFITGLGEKNAYEIGREIVGQTGIINEVYLDTTPEGMSRKENIDELMNGMSDFCQSRLEEGITEVLLTDFLSEVSLLTDLDSDKDGDGEKVTLMTIHASKGLEFKNVFVVGMEENLFPSSMSNYSPKGLEEERRLFYVAITRAGEHCYLSYARNRSKYGKMEVCTRSRFLNDIDDRFIQRPHGTDVAKRVDEEVGRFRRESGRLGDVPPWENNDSTDRRSRNTDRSYGNERSAAPSFAPQVPRNLKLVRQASVSSAGTSSSPTVSSGSSASIPQPRTGSSSLPGGSSVPGVLQPGQFIEHERFGVGEVLKMEGTGDNAKATIRFKHAGEKQLLLRFARFKVLD